MTAFCAFGLSWGGKEWGGLARNSSGYDYQGSAERSLDQKLSALAGKTFRFTSLPYDQLDIPDGATVYCDPPYLGTTGYRANKGFDHAAFWSWAGILSTRCRVLVSEQGAPAGWAPAVAIRHTQNMRHADGHRVIEEYVWELPSERQRHAAGSVAGCRRPGAR